MTRDEKIRYHVAWRWAGEERARMRTFDTKGEAEREAESIRARVAEAGREFETAPQVGVTL